MFSFTVDVSAYMIIVQYPLYPSSYYFPVCAGNSVLCISKRQLFVLTMEEISYYSHSVTKSLDSDNSVRDAACFYTVQHRRILSWKCSFTCIMKPVHDVARDVIFELFVVNKEVQCDNVVAHKKSKMPEVTCRR